MAKKPIITLTTDFGLNDHFIGTMKGVILSIEPEAEIVDICHSVQAFDVLDGALTISQAYSYFPTGTVHMVIGGGGTSVPSNTLFFDPPQCRVITAVGAPDPKTGKRPPVYVKEQAPWSAVRNAAHSYGLAAFAVDPGSDRGGITTIKVTYYDVVGPDGQVAPFETFTLRRPRRD